MTFSDQNKVSEMDIKALGEGFGVSMTFSINLNARFSMLPSSPSLDEWIDR